MPVSFVTATPAKLNYLKANWNREPARLDTPSARKLHQAVEQSRTARNQFGATELDALT